MNIDEQAAADAIMSARHSDAFDREACVKILRDAQHEHLWVWHCDLNNQPYGLCACGASNEDFREPERQI